MKVLILALLLTVYAATTKADPILIGGGTATITASALVANWDASGFRYECILLNTSPTLFITALSFSLPVVTVPSVTIAPFASQWFSVEFPGTFFTHFTSADAANSMSIYFTLPLGAPDAIPEPASMLLLGSGLVGLAHLLKLRIRSS